MIKPGSPEFKAEVEKKLEEFSKKTGLQISRPRRWIAFERFLARVPRDSGWMLKGSFAIELLCRPACRPAADLDFSLPSAYRLDYSTPPEIVPWATQDIGDGFRFEATPIEEETCAWADGSTYGRGRSDIVCYLGDQIFESFRVDADLGDLPVLDAKTSQLGTSILDFAGIERPSVTLVPIETQFAEKIHAYTLPANQRAKPRNLLNDYLDIVFLLERFQEKTNDGNIFFESVDRMRLAHCIKTTFERRRSEGIPYLLPDPPSTWDEDYKLMALGMGLRNHYSLAGTHGWVKCEWAYLVRVFDAGDAKMIGTRPRVI